MSNVVYSPVQLNRLCASLKLRKLHAPSIIQGICGPQVEMVSRCGFYVISVYSASGKYYIDRAALKGNTMQNYSFSFTSWSALSARLFAIGNN